MYSGQLQSALHSARARKAVGGFGGRSDRRPRKLCVHPAAGSTPDTGQTCDRHAVRRHVGMGQGEANEFCPQIRKKARAAMEYSERSEVFGGVA